MEKTARAIKFLLFDDEIENCTDQQLLAVLAARYEELLDRVEYRIQEIGEEDEA